MGFCIKYNQNDSKNYELWQCFRNSPKEKAETHSMSFQYPEIGFLSFNYSKYFNKSFLPKGYSK